MSAEPDGQKREPGFGPEGLVAARRSWSRRRTLEVFGPLIALALLVLVTTAFNPKFLLPENILNVV